jgi:PPOX class probable F420-dependent enzyme
VEVGSAVAFVRQRRAVVLVTMRRDGRPQLSNVIAWAAGDDTIRISITTGRAKYHNLSRDPWAAVYATSEDFWTYVVIEGPVGLTAPATATDDDVVAQLVEYFRALNGEHDDWDDYRAAMVREHRVLATIRPSRAYGTLPG